MSREQTQSALLIVVLVALTVASVLPLVGFYVGPLVATLLLIVWRQRLRRFVEA